MFIVHDKNQQCLTICWAFMIISMMGIGDACQGFSMTTSNCHLVPSEYSNNQSAARAAISDLPHRGIFTPRCQVRIQVILLISVSIFSNVACFFFSCDQAALWMVQSVRLSVRLSVHLSVTPFWLCSHHRIITKFAEVITNDRSGVHAKGQGHRSKVKVTKVITQLSRFRTVTPVWIHIWW